MTAESAGEIGSHPAYIGLIAALCVIAVLLNFIVIFAVIKFGRYRASIDIFLTNLAASDIIHAGIVTPLHLKNATNNGDFYGNNFVCKLTMFMPKLSVMGAILTIVAIAIDRYRVIVIQKHINRRGALTAIACIWLTSILVSAPQLYEYNVYEDTDEYNSNVTYISCGSEGIVEHFETVYASCVFVFAFLVPLFILFICYMKLLLYVWRHGKRFRKTQEHRVGESTLKALQKQVRRNGRINKMLSVRMVRILKMLIWITATFVGFWTPYFIIFGMTEIMGIDDTSNFKEWPHVACRTMTVLSTISNPVLYLVFSEAFRDALCNKNKGILRLNLSSRVARGQTNTGTNKIRPMSVCEVKDYSSEHTEQTEIFTIRLKRFKKGTEDPKQMTLENVSSC